MYIQRLRHMERERGERRKRRGREEQINRFMGRFPFVVKAGNSTTQGCIHSVIHPSTQYSRKCIAEDHNNMVNCV